MFHEYDNFNQVYNCTQQGEGGNTTVTHRSVTDLFTPMTCVFYAVRSPPFTADITVN